jgi:hypothetical protein
MAGVRNAGIGGLLRNQSGGRVFQQVDLSSPLRELFYPPRGVHLLRARLEHAWFRRDGSWDRQAEAQLCNYPTASGRADHGYLRLNKRKSINHSRINDNICATSKENNLYVIEN